MIRWSTFRRSHIRLERRKGQLFGDQMVNFSIDKNNPLDAGEHQTSLYSRKWDCLDTARSSLVIKLQLMKLLPVHINGVPQKCRVYYCSLNKFVIGEYPHT